MSDDIDSIDKQLALLRDQDREFYATYSMSIANVCTQAIDAITSLRAEVAAQANTIRAQEGELKLLRVNVSRVRASADANETIASLTQELETAAKSIVALIEDRDALRERVQSIENICDRAGKGNLQIDRRFWITEELKFALPTETPPMTDETDGHSDD